MNFESVFSDFIFRDDLSLDVKSYESACMKKKELDQGRKISNVGGWQSNDLNENDDFIFNTLIQKISDNLNFISNAIGIKNKIALSNIWININEHKDFNMLHDHFNSVISGVFYVKVPKNSQSKIHFINPSEKKRTFLKLADLEIEQFNMFNSFSCTIEPYENLMVMFPSWMDHWVEPNQSQEPRISISFNSKWW